MRLGLVAITATIGCLASAPVAAAVAPVTSITAGPAEGALTNDNTPTFEFTANQPVIGFGCSIDAADPNVTFACASPFTTPPLPDGGHTFRAAGTNAAQEIGAPAFRNFIVDTTPPDTTIHTGPAEGETINTDAPAFTWSSTEVNSTFVCVADAVPLTACEEAFITGAAEGQHSFSVAARDPAGNVDPTPATRNFTIRLSGVPPLISRCLYDGIVINGTSGADTRIGSPRTDLMFGLAGDDVLSGAGGPDCISGAAGNDRLRGGTGDDVITGGVGNDRLTGDAGRDDLRGGAGNDTITGGAGTDVLVGDAGTDRLTDSVGRDSFSGGAGNDRVNSRDTSAFGRRVADSVGCGSGRFDVAIVDRADRVRRDCERVSRR